MKNDNLYPVTNFPSVAMTDSMNEAMEHIQKVTGQPFGRVRGKVVCVQWDNDSGPAVFDGLVNDTNGTCSAVVRGMGDHIAILIHWSQISGQISGEW